MRRAALCGLCLVVAACGGATRTRPAPPAVAAVPAPATLEGRRAAFAQAHAAVAAERYADAIATLEPLCPAYAEMQDYCLHDLAISRARSGDAEAADQLWTQLAATQPKSVFAPRAALERGRYARAQDDLDTARALLDAARASENEDIATQALLELAEVELADGDVPAALADLTAVRTQAPGTSLGRSARQRIDQLRRQDPALEPHGAALESELRLLLKERDFSLARVTADRLLATAPPGDRAELLRLRAEAELGAGQTEEGLATLQAIARDEPDAGVAPEAQFRYASLLWNRDRNIEAQDAFLEFSRRYPGHPRMPEVLYALARIAQGEEHADDAIRIYERLADDYPSSPQAGEARWRIGWILYQQGRFPAAASAFADAAAGATGAARAEALYWRGRSLERAGDRAGALGIYDTLLAEAPASYYAYWAEQRIGRPAAGLQPIAPPAPRAIGPVPPGGDPYHWSRAVELQAMGLRPLGRAELRAFERDHSDNPAATEPLLIAYQSVDGYRDAIRLAHARGLTDPNVFFPLAYWPQVERHTRGTDLDPLFVLALMRQESMFDPAARSPADARGLMQLLPSTAEGVAQRTGQPSPEGKLYDPETNVTLGVAHLHELMAAYGGDPIRTMAAYNGGAAAVAKWQRRFGSLPPDEFVESITYRETREYVKRVMGNYRRYQQEYGAH